MTSGLSSSIDLLEVAILAGGSMHMISIASKHPKRVS